MKDNSRPSHRASSEEKKMKANIVESIPPTENAKTRNHREDAEERAITIVFLAFYFEGIGI